MITKSTNHNPNYLASIVKIDEFRPHINPKVERMKMVNLFGNSVITGIDAKPGVYIYFPLECAICQQFLSYTNSFRDKELNTDKNKSGFFEMHGRVRAVKLQGSPSEGYIVPASQLENFCKYVLSKEIKIDEKFVGTDFDEICGFQICKKYIPKGIKISNEGISKKTKGNIKRYESKLIENQFHFHPDSGHLKRQVETINPDDYISVTNKLHGCNFVVSNVLVKRKITFLEKIAKYFGVKVVESEYGMLYSSRSVIKNSTLNDDKQHNHFYDTDIWKIVADLVFPSLPQGISVTGEIVGYTPSGKAIQPLYDYSCKEGELDFYVFNITYTSSEGKVFTFSHRQKEDFCLKMGIKTPKTFYYGKAKDHFPELLVDDNWHKNFLDKMMTTYMEKKCNICKNDVWAEGVIVNVDKPNEWIALKLKCFNFLSYETKQLDDVADGKAEMIVE
jgi:hypothetical protein